MKKKLITTLLTAAMMVSTLAGCGNTDSSTSTSSDVQSTAQEETPAADNTADDTAQAADEDTAASGEAVTIKLFSNLPDRKNGQGLVEQMIIDEYMAANTNVKIEVEALDEEAYKTKFKAYAMDGMPDVVSIWGQPSFLDEV